MDSPRTMLDLSSSGAVSWVTSTHRLIPENRSVLADLNQARRLLTRGEVEDLFMSIAFVAQTRDHLLMLDDEGVCLHVHRRSKERGDDAMDGAIACIGAQYVAALDPREPGYLAHSPTLGVPMLFAKVGDGGKISIVRTGPLERFEVRGSGIHERPLPTRDPLLDSNRSLSPSIQYVSETEEDEPTLRLRRVPPNVRHLTSRAG